MQNAILYIQKKLKGAYEIMNSEKNTTSLSEYYEESLYKFQDGVLNTVKASGAPFYLTGGTALSRAYYGHRYSDDLDFFINKNSDFNKYADSVMKLFSENGYTWSNETEFQKTPNFYSLILHHSDYKQKLKIDFVNDVEVHFGEFLETPIFYKTDSVRNILSNKVSAVFRFAAKDMVDIREICLHERFNWEKIFEEVRQKEIGVEPNEVAQILEGTPKEQFERIKWIRKPEWETFQKDIHQIAKDMISLTDNTLFR